MNIKKGKWRLNHQEVREFKEANRIYGENRVLTRLVEQLLKIDLSDRKLLEIEDDQ